MKKIKFDISYAIIHTGHGSHYSAHEYQELLKELKCYCSMSRLANSLDNYSIEHHFSILKREMLWKININDRTIENIKCKINTCYEFYNSRRIQRNKRVL
ncbi:MAG: hypothetical protein LBV48_02090 [Mycoplasmataceae bacterium]|jgi:transposase InsO family protein|nr:hypothetical protein [Mycoplasmataceae bacterium]